MVFLDLKRRLEFFFRRRLHQQSFRERVLKAYREQCALCRLRHRELLDAAHILPDSEPEGEPNVSNGLALCKLHHAAFDKLILGITPDYIVVVRSDILEESDGPMLRFGLQGIHHQTISVPRSSDLRPDRDMLAWRYEQFQKAV
jgi:putative restriction endonuclease